MNIRRGFVLYRQQIGAGIVFGLMAGTAIGQNVTIPWPTVTYKGSAEFIGSVIDNAQCVNFYTVPAGLKFRLTSFLLDSLGSPTPIQYQSICAGDANGVCAHTRTNYITAPAGGTLSVPLTSGMLFNSGETVLACAGGVTKRSVAWSFYGFLYR